MFTTVTHLYVRALAPRFGQRNGNYRTGHYTKENLATLQFARRLLREGKNLAKALGGRQ